MQAPPELVETLEWSVTEDQIDHLGHMNVRFYGVAAGRGGDALLARCGLGESSGVRVVDRYTRHHREQLLGAALVVRSGVVEATPRRVRLYHELVNRETGVVAATFVYTTVPEGPDGLGTPVLDALAGHLVEIPEYGRSRSIPLDTDALASAPTLEVVRDRRLAIREPRRVTAEECDATGRYLPSMAPALLWMGEPVDRGFPEMLHAGPNGEQMGWASMETRITAARFPRVDEEIQSFSAVVHVGDKILHNMMWAYGLEHGDLLVSFEIVNLAFDVGGRRPMVIPDEIRAHQERLLQPDLAPR
jgi:acyl-CoA thioesterase FadM